MLIRVPLSFYLASHMCYINPLIQNYKIENKLDFAVIFKTLGESFFICKLFKHFKITKFRKTFHNLFLSTYKL